MSFLNITFTCKYTHGVSAVDVDWGLVVKLALPGKVTILGPTNRYSNKKKGIWPSCVERCTPKPVSQ
jgi:hypothetical protein